YPHMVCYTSVVPVGSACRAHGVRTARPASPQAVNDTSVVRSAASCAGCEALPPPACAVTVPNPSPGSRSSVHNQKILLRRSAVGTTVECRPVPVPVCDPAASPASVTTVTAVTSPGRSACERRRCCRTGTREGLSSPSPPIPWCPEASTPSGAPPLGRADLGSTPSTQHRTGGDRMTAHQPSTADTREHASAADVLARDKAYLDTFVVGQHRLRESLLIGLLTEGHLLLESVPGLAKTTAASALSGAVSASFARIQCTPDLLPSDIIGTQIYNSSTGAFDTRLGPVHAHIVLLDEINRSSAKTQSAMLEAMQERQTTIGGRRY